MVRTTTEGGCKPRGGREGTECQSSFVIKGYRFFFYSNEGSPREPVHVHVRGNKDEAKFWSYPMVHLGDSHGFDARTLRELAEAVEQNAALIEKAWNEHFG